MHHTLLPKWVGRDAITLFAQEMGMVQDELDRSEWTETDEYIEPASKWVWADRTKEVYWVTIDLKAYLFWIALLPDERDAYCWEQICQGCGNHRDRFGTMKVEIDDGRTMELALCDKICAPDFWDDTAPGEYTVMQHVYPNNKTIEVRLKNWRCENCESVCEHGLMKLVSDTDDNPPSHTIICSFCRAKEPTRWIEA